jgi:hypothetical protein
LAYLKKDQMLLVEYSMVKESSRENASVVMLTFDDNFRVEGAKTNFKYLAGLETLFCSNEYEEKDSIYTKNQGKISKKKIEK